MKPNQRLLSTRHPWQLQPAIIGARRQQRLAPVVKTVTSYAKEEKIRLTLVLTFFAAHVPLAFLMARDYRIATFHVLVTMTIAVLLAMFSQRLERVAYAGAYITGAEVLWRMTYAQSFWETGKYGVALIFIIAMLRNWRRRPDLLPVLYFLLLLPSAVLTLQAHSMNEARSLFSSELSGPFALMIASCFFSQFSLSKESLLRLFLALIGPIICVAAVALIWITHVENLVFRSDSNVYSSGGFGPNQVSAILGLGALIGFLILVDRDVTIKLKFLCGATMLVFAGQSALTFSRGGLYNALGAISLASLFLLKDSRTRVQFILAMLLASAVSYFLILPRLDRFTDGALSARFEETNMTGREEIARVDLDIWFNNALLGVGPGIANEHRETALGHSAASHTEFTRMLAEHGTLGLLASLVFISAVVRNLIMAQTAKDKAAVIALMAWSVLFMLNTGMRLVAPSLIFGLAFALVTPSRKRLATAREVAA